MGNQSEMKTQRVAIISPTGMLGSMVYNVLKDKYKLVLIYRNKGKLEKLNAIYGGVEKHTRVLYDLNLLYEDYLHRYSASHDLITSIGQVDVVINCAGITIPHSLKSPIQTLFINGALPGILSRCYKDKLIQITTDCVFDGLHGAPYNEESLHNPTDLYGLSKSMGEPSQHSLVLRTSIIGPEIGQSDLLIEWFKKQGGKVINGYTNHFWNGITTKQYALICDKIIQNRNQFPKQGLFHIFSSSVNKYEMLFAFKEKYNIAVEIIPKKVNPLDRRLDTKYSLCKELNIPSFEEMMKAL
jgi:dTDP-4-dehydrorhamnose reductase